MTIAAVLCCAMTTAVLTACTDANDNPANPAVPTSAVDNGTWQVTSEMMDLSYRPGDDFFMYCTGGFWKATTVDESKRDFNKGMTKEAEELMNQRVAALNIPAQTKLKSDLAKTDDASVALMKETIQKAVDRIQAVTTKEELWHLLGQLISEGYKMPYKPQLFSYHGRMATVLFVDSESGIGAGLMSDDNKHDFQWRLMNDPALLARLQPLHGAKTRGFDHDAWPMVTGIMEGLGIDLDNVYGLEFNPFIPKENIEMSIEGFAQEQKKDLDELKYNLIVSVTSDAILYDDSKLAQMNEATGANSTRADLMDSFIKANMKYTLSHAFAEAYVTPAMKQQTREKCEEIRKSLRQRFAANQWMSAASKQNAIEKLDAMVFNIGCPDEWLEEGLPDLTNEPTVLHDVMAVRRANVQLAKKLIGMDTPRAGIHMLIYGSFDFSVINAFYVGNLNSMNIYPAWMLKPFCDETLNEAHNYAAYAVFGHEITHGFDTNGACFNKIGDPEEIWASSADRQEFQRRANLLAECYSGFEVMPWTLPGVYNDGAYTVAENIADLGGFLTAYDTYMHHLQDAGFTGEQFDLQRRRFYEAYAWLWHGKYSAIYAHDRTLDTDVKDDHSLFRERVNGIVSNTDDWYDIYSVSDKDKLYRAEDKRIRIW